MTTDAIGMTGKVCLITGGSSGIGRATAIRLAGMGATVVIAGRDAARIDETLAAVRARAASAPVASMRADMSSMAETRRVAEEFAARYQRLDVLINNAGVMRTARAVTADGFEWTFAVNHLSHFLLTNLLLDLLKRSAPARVVNVSSDAHQGATIDFDDLQNERRYGGFRVYGQSKLANVLFTYELGRRLSGTGVTVNCLHPGVVATRFGSGSPGLFGRGLRAGLVLARPFLRSPEKGARTSIYLASSPQAEGVTGAYFQDCAEAESSAASHDEVAARRLWDVSAQLTGLNV